MLLRIVLLVFISVAVPRMVVAAESAGTAHSRIGLIRIAEPQSYESWVLAAAEKPDVHVTGLWNMRGLIKEARSAINTKNITDSISSTGFKLSTWLTENLQQALEKAGYEVVLVDRIGSKRLDANTLPQTNVPVDAYLDVHVGFAGYVADKPGAAFSPVIEAPALLITPDGKKPLYANTFRYGSSIPALAPGKMADNHAYDVKNLETDQIIVGLKAAATNVAQMMAQYMR
jgi:hypothetical protein